ncbi:bifunctional DNA-formamidopyrimidine glycosylase/DNA-(apurinic or apyrimidinic site) lyase [Aporhodopirellula aestuarii]|uniref:Formamidopyrimidine-DNA glycosylase n=1 Tax=Aporhodopirellula aestuarii TaxID=2950107 RepID=A0ABT0UDA7_9BACT|nr:bifunctional DNA-formamidopyrimidine glycosylase/DNA-(apurinic or apyrimidinic site) lyase [Aporhodopirellula aestuarii]MCM2374864.1 bifunctional DNA-formamidopyrimidine glycosylase/DNA-(apurinic or apyrimidinic site) lyase [Aporhodopirellula aestuarii]
MPELPEVETMCRGIRPIVGRRVHRIEQPPCSCRPCTTEPSVKTMHRKLAGNTVAAIERRGKRVMLRFDNDHRLVIEPRMSGLVLLSDPPGVDHLRLRIEFSDWDKAPSLQMLVWDRRGLGTIRLLSPDEYEKNVNSRLGDDALVITRDALAAKLNSSRREIKVALLDQTVVAGIGNLYAAEILFVAGIDPRLRCEKLTRAQWSRLHAAIGLVLSEAIANEGSTLSDGTYRNALNQSGGYQNMHRVYDRAGDICARCGEGEIRRIVQAQRSTFFCGHCQRRSGVHPAVE